MRTTHGWSRSLAEMLIGADPFELARSAAGSTTPRIYAGRRGLGIHALSAVDVALHDLVGKQLGRPVYQLLGGARASALRPYATIYPGPAPDGRARELHRRSGAALRAGAGARLPRGQAGVPLYDLVTDRELVDCHPRGPARARATTSR